MDRTSAHETFIKHRFARHFTTPWIFCLWIFVGAFALRFALAFVTGMIHDPQRREMERIAISLIRTGVYGNPYSTQTGPSAHSSPGYPLVLAALMKFFGVGFREQVAQTALSCGLVALRCAALAAFAFRAGLGTPTARIAGLLSMFWIGALETEVKGQWDAPATALLLFVMFSLHYFRPLRSGGARRAASYGIGWGIVVLFSSSSVFAVFAMLIAELLIWLRERKDSLAAFAWRAAILGACLLLVQFPWALRNKRAMGAWIFSRSNFGMEMWLTYHSGAAVSNVDNIQYHPYYVPAESQHIAAVGEVAYNHEKLQAALDWVLRNPTHTARLIALHTLQFWFPINRGILFSVLQSAFTVLFFCGIVRLRRSNPLLFLHLSALVLFFPLIYYLDQWSSRYRYPIEWIMVLSAAVALSDAWPTLVRVCQRDS